MVLLTDQECSILSQKINLKSLELKQYQVTQLCSLFTEMMVCVHVDDLFMAGNKEFKELVNNKLMLQFKFSKIEVKKFKYLGCEIQQMTNGDISLNQNDYTQKLSDVIIPEGRRTDMVDEGGKNTIRKAVGELLWISLMTRPDLSFEVNQLSGNITNATIKDMRKLKQIQ